jgi:hypothetical protein
MGNAGPAQQSSPVQPSTTPGLAAWPGRIPHAVQIPAQRVHPSHAPAALHVSVASAPPPPTAAPKDDIRPHTYENREDEDSMLLLLLARPS